VEDTPVRSAAVEALERQIIKANEGVVAKYEHYLNAPTAPAIKGDYARTAMARVLESTERVLTAEATQTTTVFGSNYVKAMLGMTRQIMPRLFGQRLVSVQPLDRPSGQIFHLNITRDDDSTDGLQPSADFSANTDTTLLAKTGYADHATGEGGAIGAGMKLGITSSTVNISKVKKLKTAASWELQTDLAAVHGLSALDLLQGAAVDEIAREIDGLIVKAVKTAASGAGQTVTFGPAPSGYPIELWPQRLQRAILEAHKIVRRRSLRNPNVMVVGIDAFVELQDLAGYKMAPSVDWTNSVYGLQPVGTLNGQYEVLLSDFVPANEIILGRRGAGFLDAGIVYSPYVGLFVSDRFFDVNTQVTTQSFASRFDIITVSNTLYSRVVIDEDAVTPGISVA
jgi:hypothetical protein